MLLLRQHVAEQIPLLAAAEHRELALVDARRAVLAGMVDADHFLDPPARGGVAGQPVLAHADSPCAHEGHGDDGTDRQAAQQVQSPPSRPARRGSDKSGRRTASRDAPASRRAGRRCCRRPAEGAAHSGSGLGQAPCSTPTWTTPSPTLASMVSTTSSGRSPGPRGAAAARRAGRARSRPDTANAPPGTARRAPRRRRARIVSAIARPSPAASTENRPIRCVRDIHMARGMADNPKGSKLAARGTTA